MELNRNVSLLIVVSIVLVLKIIFAEIYYRKEIPSPVKEFVSRTGEIEQLKKDLLLSELKMLEKKVERDLLLKQLQKLIGQKEVEKFVERSDLKSLLSDIGFGQLFQVTLQEEFDLDEEGVRRLFALLQENQEVLLQPSQPISGLVSEEKRSPLLKFAEKHQPSASLHFGDGSAQGSSRVQVSSGDPNFFVQEYRGLDPVIPSGSLLISLVKAVLQTFFDVSRVLLYNKEVFSIVGIFLALIIGMIVVYSMHFR